MSNHTPLPGEFNTLCDQIQGLLRENATAVTSLLDGARRDRIQGERERLEQELRDFRTRMAERTALGKENAERVRQANTEARARLQELAQMAKELNAFLHASMTARLDGEQERIKQSMNDASGLRKSVSNIKAETHRLLAANGWTR